MTPRPIVIKITGSVKGFGFDLPEGSFVDDLVGCARCHGEGHLGVTWLKLDHPIVMEDGYPDMTHWAPCPKNGQPILLAFTEESSS